MESVAPIRMLQWLNKFLFFQNFQRFSASTDQIEAVSRREELDMADTGVFFQSVQMFLSSKVPNLTDSVSASTR